MNINFSPLRNFSISNFNKLNNNSYSTNPIKYNKTLNKDEVCFGGRLKKSEKEKNLKEKIELLKNIKEQILATQKQIANLKKEYSSLGKSVESVQKKESLEKQIQTSTAEIRNLAHLAIKLQQEIKFLQCEIKRPNAAFLYDPSLSTEEKKEELKKHPEFKTLKEAAQDIKSNDDTDFSPLEKFFLYDTLDGEQYIDISQSVNSSNYNALKTALTDNILLYDLLRGTNANYGYARSALINMGLLDSVKLRKPETNSNENLSIISKSFKDKAENIANLTPRPSKYYIMAQQDRTKPVFVPLSYLIEIGYGPLDELIDACRRNKIDGAIKEFQQEDGTIVRQLCVNINSPKTKANIKPKSKYNNSNFCTVKTFMKNCHVSLKEIRFAALEGDVVLANKFIYSEDKLGIDLTNPINIKFAEEHGYIIKTEEEPQIVQEEQEEEAAEYSYGFSIQGLRAKIAWHLSEHTREIAAQMAKGDGYLAKIFEKQEKEREEKRQNKNTPPHTQLTKAEKIRLNEYYKRVWEEAGTQEFSDSMRIAIKITDLYLEQGIDAIKDPEIRKVIEEYTAQNN